MLKHEMAWNNIQNQITKKIIYNDLSLVNEDYEILSESIDIGAIFEKIKEFFKNIFKAIGNFIVTIKNKVVNFFRKIFKIEEKTKKDIEKAENASTVEEAKEILKSSITSSSSSSSDSSTSSSSSSSASTKKNVKEIFKNVKFEFESKFRGNLNVSKFVEAGDEIAKTIYNLDEINKNLIKLEDFYDAYKTEDEFKINLKKINDIFNYHLERSESLDKNSSDLYEKTKNFNNKIFVDKTFLKDVFSNKSSSMDWLQEILKTLDHCQKNCKKNIDIADSLKKIFLKDEKKILDKNKQKNLLTSSNLGFRTSKSFQSLYNTTASRLINIKTTFEKEDLDLLKKYKSECYKALSNA